MERGFLASGNQFFFFFFFKYSWQLKLFSPWCKFIFTTNPLFWLLETDFLASGNHFAPMSQITFLLKAAFPSSGNIFKTNLNLLQPVATYFVFNGNDILSFIFSLKPLLPLQGDQYLKEFQFC